jgi:hypothetical protein
MTRRLIVAVTEADRRVLHQTLAAKLGEREANILMEILPPLDWGDLARQGDIGAVRSEIDAVRSEIAAVRAEIDNQGAALRLEMQVMESRLTVGFHRDMVRQTWILAGTLLAGLGGLGSLLH